MECEECPIFKKQEERVLKCYNSAFDCAIEMHNFKDECKLTCAHNRYLDKKGD